MDNKIVRSICYFSFSPEEKIIDNIDKLAEILEDNNFIIQTKRICSREKSIKDVDSIFKNTDLYQSVGTLDRQTVKNQINDFIEADNVAFNIDISDGPKNGDEDFLLYIIKNSANKTFNFAYTFNNVPSSPFFPSATFEKEGFALGLQPTDLAEGCDDLNEWFEKMKIVWDEIVSLFHKNEEFLGIDSSVASLFSGKSSFINFIKRCCSDFSQSVTSGTYFKISEFIRKHNPKPIGLCGIMFPCIEDFELADEYEKGNFTIERNIYLSLHSGLGLDTYPVGIDESPSRILEILDLISSFSNKYHKPLSARFISDGKAKIGEKTNFKNQYLKDVIIRPL